jgi:hypothetical protein
VVIVKPKRIQIGFLSLNHIHQIRDRPTLSEGYATENLDSGMDLHKRDQTLDPIINLFTSQANTNADVAHSMAIPY